jgi:hypothetical protein
MKRFKFKYRARGQWIEVEIVAENYALACYELGRLQGDTFARFGHPPSDFLIDLSKEQEGVPA